MSTVGSVRTTELNSVEPDYIQEATAYLTERGITPMDAERAGIFPVISAKEIHAGFKAMSALMIPYSDPTTGSPMTYSANGAMGEFKRVRYLGKNTTKSFVAKNKEQRYAQPKGSPVLAYFVAGGFIDWPSIFLDSEIPIVITEGEFKAICACRHGIPTIALGGVWNFTTKDGSLLPELQRIVWHGRRVIICYDSDLADNPNVQGAEQRLVMELRRRGAVVHLARLPSASDGAKLGLDDAIRQFGHEHVKTLLLSAPKAPEAVIELAPQRLNENLKELDEALAMSGLPIFQRSGAVVHVVQLGELEQADGIRRAADAPIIRETSAIALQQLAMRAAKFVRWNETKKALLPTECSRILAEHHIGKVDGWSLPYLRGVVEAPTIRLDGSVLQTAGYDQQSEFLYLPSAEFCQVPEAPTQRDACAAIAKLRRVVRGFEFASPEGEAVWIAAVLTAVVRRSLRTAPLFAISAPVMGAGKTLAADLISIIATGHEPAVMSQGRNPDEDRKRLLSVLIRGDAVVQIDNCELPIEGDTLCAILTSPEWQDRLLGRSEMVRVPTNATFLATGNNVAFRGDMSTRALMCKILPREERPEERVFDWDARAEVRAERSELVVAALTIMRAYIVAGSPPVNAKTFGRFEEWQRLVRDPLLWLDAADPCKTRELAERNDPDREDFSRLIYLWRVVFDLRAVRVKEIGELAVVGIGVPPEARELYEIACELSGGRGRDVFDAAAFGKYLATKEERLSGGYRLIKGVDKKRKTATWRLQADE